jgi:hypothetical protein
MKLMTLGASFFCRPAPAGKTLIVSTQGEIPTVDFLKVDGESIHEVLLLRHRDVRELRASEWRPSVGRRTNFGARCVNG